MPLPKRTPDPARSPVPGLIVSLVPFKFRFLLSSCSDYALPVTKRAFRYERREHILRFLIVIGCHCVIALAGDSGNICGMSGRIIEVRPSRTPRWQKMGDWEVNEGNEVCPVYCDPRARDSALSYARQRAAYGHAEIQCWMKRGGCRNDRQRRFAAASVTLNGGAVSAAL